MDGRRQWTGKPFISLCYAHEIYILRHLLQISMTSFFRRYGAIGLIGVIDVIGVINVIGVVDVIGVIGVMASVGCLVPRRLFVKKQ